MLNVGGNLYQGDEHKAPFGHTGMRNFQVVIFRDQVVVQKNVNIYYARSKADRFYASHRVFNLFKQNGAAPPGPAFVLPPTAIFKKTRLFRHAPRLCFVYVRNTRNLHFHAKALPPCPANFANGH